MSLKQPVQSGLLVLVAAGAMVLGAIAVPAAQTKTTSLLLSLPNGSIVGIPPGPCAPSEGVVLGGDTHVVTQVRSDGVDVHLNTAGIQGTGLSTGNMYIGTGSQKLTFATPPDPNTPVNANFTLEHTDGCASTPLGLSFSLSFASDGTLLPSSSVFVTSFGIINPPQ